MSTLAAGAAMAFWYHVVDQLAFPPLPPSPLRTGTWIEHGAQGFPPLPEVGVSVPAGKETAETGLLL